MKAKRRREFQRNPSLEDLLGKINGLLRPVEDQVLTNFSMPKYPVILTLGCARSGTTLLMQWLAQSDYFTYPTNLLSRFYKAPYVGALIQQLLTNPLYNFNDEFRSLAQEISFESSLGKTKGILSPNEFWYFWRRFIPNTDSWYLDSEALKAFDTHTFTSELAAIESVFDKPLAMKGMILELNIPFLSSILEKVLFLYVRRHPIYNAQSLLESRIKFFGDQQAWYSFKPREYKDLKELTPIEQVMGQVYYTNRAIEEGLEQLDASQSLTIDYEAFCTNPAEVFSQLKAKLIKQGCHTLDDYAGPIAFEPTNQVRLSSEDCEQLVAAYRRFSGKGIRL